MGMFLFFSKRISDSFDIVEHLTGGHVESGFDKGFNLKLLFKRPKIGKVKKLNNDKLLYFGG